MYRLFYFDEVKTDVREAKRWYKQQIDGLEKRFAGSIKTALSQIKQNPFMYAVSYGNIRIARTKVFPYNIFFYVDEINSIVVIVAIIHNKRDRNTVYTRL